MDPEHVRTLLAAVKEGSLSLDDAFSQLRELPFRALGFAHADTHRHLRTGFPEVVFGTGKTTAQIAILLRELGRDGATVMATRIAPDVAKEVLAAVPGARYLEAGRIVVLGPAPGPTRGRGPIAVLTAGTADIPVAEEAATTAELDGNQVVRVFDVGVSGLHRLLAHREIVEKAEVLVAVAGMDGVLPTVVAGLFSRPVIAVPTSVGYGASLGGLSALLTMLNSCATGVAVVNIDNGFGAGRMASLLNRVRAA
ncbi:MAG: nickel pincer cofactor biosynthesis protein LarB [Deltaproteobacteria bacterium]|nr:nickel pincer cofactor biosynthesis protein LarB [Deltaproteobacteria bacterium]